MPMNKLLHMNQHNHHNNPLTLARVKRVVAKESGNNDLETTTGLVTDSREEEVGKDTKDDSKADRNNEEENGRTTCFH